MSESHCQCMYFSTINRILRGDTFWRNDERRTGVFITKEFSSLLKYIPVKPKVKENAKQLEKIPDIIVTRGLSTSNNDKLLDCIFALQ